MKHCENSDPCHFYNNCTDAERAMYCAGEGPLLCARSMVRKTLGADRVPADLHPGEVGRAVSLILSERRSDDRWNSEEQFD